MQNSTSVSYNWTSKNMNMNMTKERLKDITVQIRWWLFIDHTFQNLDEWNNRGDYHPLR